MTRKLTWLVLLAGTFLTMPTQARQFGVEGDPLWQAVQQALNQGRPQTALEKLAPISVRADQSGDAAEKVRVLATRIDLETATTENAAPDTRLKKMRAAIDAADPALRPVMEAIHATWLWEFFQQNRWQYSQRTAVAASAAAGQ